jgi:hypothetical protein
MSPHTHSVQFKLFKSKKIAVMDLRKETIKTESRKPLLDAFQFVGIT